MDLSWLKWPIVILIVVGGLWLISSSGIRFMYNRFTQATPGQNSEQDARDERGLTNLGNFLMKTLRYDKAEHVMQTAVERYPEGKNVLLNQYRLVKLAEKRGDYENAVLLLEYLIQVNANEMDERVPPNDNLRLRADTLRETQELHGQI
jgi:tetratricopeptide (TPR) repeat protein